MAQQSKNSGLLQTIPRLPILKITSHLANGVKHFEATAKHHQSVKTVEKTRYAETGYVEEGYFEDHLIVHLTEEEKTSFGQSSIKVADLAKQVYDYWSSNALQA